MRILAAVLVMVHFSLGAQQVEAVLFNEKAFDFGEITEEGGHADHEFIMTNTTGRPIKILSVQASCGCTTPGWTKDPILPGKTGFVKASFDPKGRPGYFSKSLTVTTDFDATVISLQIKGQVVARKAVVEAVDYPVANGSLRFKFNSFPLGKIFINREPSQKEFHVFNSSDKAVNFTGKIAGPVYLKIETPKILASGEQGKIKVTYDAKLRNQFGFVSDNVEIETDDDVQPMKSFSVYATIEEFFPPQELATAPVLRLDVSSLDMGRIHQGNLITRELTVRNTGKKELMIRSLQGNCTCVTSTLEPLKIKPGAEGKLKITFASQGRTGLQQKAVTIYSNDPANPVQRVTMSGYIEN